MPAQDETLVDYAAWLDTLPKLPSNPTVEQREAYVLDLAKSMTAAVLLTQAQQRESNRVIRECTEVLTKALTMLERVELELQRAPQHHRSAATVSDDEPTAPLPAMTTAEAPGPRQQPARAALWSEGAVNVIEALSKLVAAFPWPMWAILAMCALGAVVGAYNLTYTGDYGTLGGSATAEKVNAIEDVDADSGGGGGLVLPMPDP